MVAHIFPHMAALLSLLVPKRRKQRPLQNYKVSQWCKQVIGLCLTAFLQATILVAGLMVFSEKALLGLGLMLAAGEVPRIAGAFGLDTTTRANIMSAVYTAQAAVNTTRTIVQAVK